MRCRIVELVRCGQLERSVGKCLRERSEAGYLCEVREGDDSDSEGVF